MCVSEVVLRVWVQLDHLSICVILEELVDLFLCKLLRFGVLPARGFPQSELVRVAEDVEHHHSGEDACKD